MNASRFVPLPFEGEYAAGGKFEGGYALDDSGRAGLPLVWTCRTPAIAGVMARIFAGDLDASPARRHFAAPGQPPTLVAWARQRRPGMTMLPLDIPRPMTLDPAPTQAALAAARRAALEDRRQRIGAWMACTPVQLTIGQTDAPSPRGGK